MKKFEESVIEIVRLNADDIICTSACEGKDNQASDTESICLVE